MHGFHCVTDILIWQLMTGRVNGPRMRTPCRILQNYGSKRLGRAMRPFWTKSYWALGFINSSAGEK